MSTAEALVSAAIAAVALAALAVALIALRMQVQAAARFRPRSQPAMLSVGQSALQHVGLVRFNPYHDTGGDYSFAVALLDAAGNGVVVTGLYHRDRCRVYAKPVRGWESSYELIDEERESIEAARIGDPGVDMAQPAG